jgi:hypothetical protein
MSETRLVFNGIDGSTGGYDLPPMTGEELSSFIRGESRPENLNELRYRYRQETERHLGVREGIDPDKLEEAGWGLILAHGADPAIVEALNELLELRQEQAGRFFRVFQGPDAYRPGESKTQFLARHGAGPGPADPEKVPYYLLIVGSPEDIPYKVQYELDVQYAVGRLHLSTLDEYASYARSVVMAERGQVKLPRRVSFFGVSNPGDGATKATTDLLIEPLYKRLKGGDGPGGWEVSAELRGGATKDRLADILGGGKTPALLMTGSHGVKFPLGDKLQVSRQGALLCQDWPGPEAWPRGTPIPPEHYFSGEDLGDDASLLGLLAFFFACYGGGTPLNDDFSKQAFKKQEAIAPYPFVAGLPTRMLGHPRGGALAVIGHVDRAWTFSYNWAGAGAQTVVFESALDRLLKGAPVGAAMEYFDARWAELSTVLSDELEDVEFGKQVDPYDLADLWTANNDARSYVIIGDPAVRLPVAKTDETPAERPVIEVSHAGGAVASPTRGEAEATAAEDVAPGQASALDLGRESPSGEAQAETAPGRASSLPGVDEELLTFTVSTYAAADVDHPAESELKFRTTISVVGDVETVLPAQIAAEDVPYLEWHREMVVAAWQGRLEVVRLALQIGPSLSNE